MPQWLLLLFLLLPGAAEEAQCQPGQTGRGTQSGLTLLAVRTTVSCGGCPGPCTQGLASPGPCHREEATALVEAKTANDPSSEELPDFLAFEEARRCAWTLPGRAVLPFALVATLAGLSLTLQLRGSSQLANCDSLQGFSRADESQQAAVAAESVKTIGCYFALLDSIVFTMVIPDSYDLILALGGNAIVSGAMIGAHKFGTAWGAVVMYSLFRLSSDMWRSHARLTLVFCAICNLLGTVTYATIAAVIDHGGLSPNEPLARVLLCAVFAGRIVGGCGSGMRLMITRTHIARLTPREKRPDQQSRFLFAITLGVGAGPVIAAAVKAVDVCRSHQLHFLPTGIAGLTLALCQLVAALQVSPLAGVPDQMNVEEAGVASLSSAEVSNRRSLVVYCLAFSVVRGLCLSGVEAASAMLLEVRFGWHPWIIGLTIGLAFLTCIPIRMLYVRFKANLSVANWIRLLMCVSLLGSILLFRLPQHAIRFGLSKDLERVIFAGVLLVGDGLLFPCFFLSDGLVQGLILQHPLPAETSILNLNGVNLMNTVLLDGFARVVGPALSRFHVSISGQNAYAGQQLCLTLAAALVAAAGFLPKLRQLEENQKRLGLGGVPVPGG